MYCALVEKSLSGVRLVSDFVVNNHVRNQKSASKSLFYDKKTAVVDLHKV